MRIDTTYANIFCMCVDERENKVASGPHGLPRKPVCFAHASGACVLDTGTRSLATNLAELIRYAVARADSVKTAAAALGVPVTRLFRLAARYGVRLPWRPKKGGR